MKGKVLIVVLVLLCAGLGVVLFLGQEKASREKEEALARIVTLSNQVNATQSRLNEQIQVNDTLTVAVTNQAREIQTYSNQLTVVSTELAQTEAESEALAQAAEETIASRDQKISALEGQNSELSSQMTELNAVIGELDKQINDTERRLVTSEGDREFLLGELKRMREERAELERQLTDLSSLREQIRRLKDDLSLARRIEWIRRGLYGEDQKGSEKLQAGFATPATSPGYDLTVEIRQDGAAEVVSQDTNAPAPSPTP